MPVTYSSSKTGYIQSYKVELNPTPNVNNEYLYVIITDDSVGALNPETWVLIRNRSDVSPGSVGSVTYSNVSQALIATIKDAFQNQNKVLFEGDLYRDVTSHRTIPGKFELFAVSIMK